MVHINSKSAITENATQIGFNMRRSLLVRMSEKTWNTRHQSRLYPAVWVDRSTQPHFVSPLCLPQHVFLLVATRWLQVALRAKYFLIHIQKKMSLKSFLRRVKLFSWDSSRKYIHDWLELLSHMFLPNRGDGKGWDLLLVLSVKVHPGHWICPERETPKCKSGYWFRGTSCQMLQKGLSSQKRMSSLSFF